MIKLAFAGAWAQIFAGAKTHNCQHVLDVYFQQCLHILLEYLKSPMCVKMHQVGSVVDHVNELVQNCDNVKHAAILRQALDSIFLFIQEYCQNPSAKFPDLNKEQLEVFINNYCSPCQVLLYWLTSQNLEDAYLTSILQLVSFMYQ